MGEVAAHFWLEHLGSSCAVYGYRLRSADGATVYADGQRVVVKLDQSTLRPSPWTLEARTVAEGLLRHAHGQPANGYVNNSTRP
jgi:acyl-CoA thioester hydrolase